MDDTFRKMSDELKQFAEEMLAANASTMRIIDAVQWEIQRSRWERIHNRRRPAQGTTGKRRSRARKDWT